MLRPLLQMLRNKQLFPALAANALYRPFYRLSFLAALSASGLMARLADGPIPLAQLAADSTAGDAAGAREALRAWLQMGCRLGLLQRGPEGYALRGLARKLARPENDATLALVQEAASMHHRLILQTPAKLRQGELWDLENQDGELTARSSRALEPFLVDAIRRFVPRTGPCRLLEVGCGSAIYIRHAALHNPDLTATGLELQPRVARLAQENIQAWGLRDRVTIETGDIRQWELSPAYDLVTLYNNIYYFPVHERVALLARVRQLLKPAGQLLLATCCQGGNAGMEALNLWGASNRHGGRLPGSDEMRLQLRDAGYANVEVSRLIPGDSFFAFRATAAGIR
ncbi:SAM-dependent methyltransferase [Achromobacter xylosoxidans]